MPIVGSGRVESGKVVFPDNATSSDGVSVLADSSLDPLAAPASAPASLLSVTAASLGAGASLFAGTTGGRDIVLNLKSVIGGTGIQIIQSQDDITLVATGEVQSFVSFVSLHDSPGTLRANAVLIGAANGTSLAWTPAATTANTVLTYSGSGFVWRPPAPSGVISVNAVGDGSIAVSGGPVTDTGTLNVSLIDTGVVAGTYSGATIIVDPQGRIGAAANSIAYISGAVFGSGPLNNIAVTLAPNGVASGTYTKVTVDATGRVSQGGDLTAMDITTALGYQPVDPALIGAPDGLATLDDNGRVPTTMLPAAITGAVTYYGTWDAAANNPPLGGGIGIKGQYYVVSNGGTTTLDNHSVWNVEDTVIFDGTVWDRIPGQGSTVLSVAGRVGDVVLGIGDVTGAAPLVSPVFTGNPVSVTRPAGDNSVSIATTAFVKAQGYLTNAVLSNVVLQSAVGTANGVAKLDSSGKVLLSELPTPFAGLTSTANTIVAGSLISGTANIDLAPIANVAGVYTAPTLTIDPYGRVTHAVVGTPGGVQSFTISGSAGIGVTNGTITNTGTVSLSLTNTGAIAGTYSLPTLIIGADGRISNAVSGTAGSGSVINLATAQVTNLAPVYAGMSNGAAALNQILGTNRIAVTASVSPAGVVLDLAAGVVSAGTYTTVTVDTYGRVIAGSNSGGLSANAISGLLAGRSLYTFTGTGSQTIWPLANVSGGSNDAIVSVAGILLEPGIGYTIANSTLTLTNAAGSGTPFWVMGLGSTAAGNGATTTASLTLTGDVTGTGTGSLAATLTSTGVTPGTYSFATVTVDAKGRVTAIAAGTAGSGAKVYQFTVGYDASGNINTTNPFSNVPTGWTITRDGNTQMTITHNLGRFPAAVSSLAWNANNNRWEQKYPISNTPGYGVSVNTPSTTPTNFTIYGAAMATALNGTGSQNAIFNIVI